MEIGFVLQKKYFHEPRNPGRIDTWGEIHRVALRSTLLFGIFQLPVNFQRSLQRGALYPVFNICQIFSKYLPAKNTPFRISAKYCSFFYFPATDTSGIILMRNLFFIGREA
jgi:hypothetical protein